MFKIYLNCLIKQQQQEIKIINTFYKLINITIIKY